MVKITDPSKICSLCNSHTTDKHYQRGTPVWIKSKEGDGLWCKPCYDHWRLRQPQAREQKREYMSEYRKKPDKRPRILEYLKSYRNNPIKKKKLSLQSKEWYNKTIKYKGKSIYLSYVPRIGVCNWCRSVAPFDTELTQLHHDEDRYDDDHPLRYTIEICDSCHASETNRLRYVRKMSKIGAYCRRCSGTDTRISYTGNPRWLFNKYGYEVLCMRCYDHFRKQKYDKRREYRMKSGNAPEIRAF